MKGAGEQHLFKKKVTPVLQQLLHLLTKLCCSL